MHVVHSLFTFIIYIYMMHVHVLLTQLNMCPMKRSRRKGCSKCGDYVELRVLSKSTYVQVVEAPADAVELESINLSSDEDAEEAQRPTILLLRAHGSVTQNGLLLVDSSASEGLEWTISNYMASFPSYRRSRQAVKLGVGYGFTEHSHDDSG